MPKKRQAEMTPTDVLREFMEDIEAVCVRDGTFDPKHAHWPDLIVTYRNAKKVLEKEARMRHDSANPLKIKRYLSTGEASGEAMNVRDLIEELGNILDRHESHEMFGDIIFETEDGVVYVATVEGLIGQANPDYVKEILESHDGADS